MVNTYCTPPNRKQLCLVCNPSFPYVALCVLNYSDRAQLVLLRLATLRPYKGCPLFTVPQCVIAWHFRQSVAFFCLWQFGYRHKTSPMSARYVRVDTIHPCNRCQPIDYTPTDVCKQFSLLCTTAHECSHRHTNPIHSTGMCADVARFRMVATSQRISCLARRRVVVFRHWQIYNNILKLQIWPKIDFFALYKVQALRTKNIYDIFLKDFWKLLFVVVFMKWVFCAEWFWGSFFVNFLEC